jgi:hypothetical protein
MSWRPLLRRLSVASACVLVGASSVACSSDDSKPASPTSPASIGDASSGDAGPSGADGGESGRGTIDGIPFGDPAAFNDWLHTGEYKTWPHESAPHASTGPHGSSVQAYLSPKLDASLTAGDAAHPAGSAAVKEFVDNGTVSGWAAMIKTQDDSAGGDGWYWYEVFDASPGATAAFEGLGHTTCKGCHAAGRDFVRIPHPLQ